MKRLRVDLDMLAMAFRPSALPPLTKSLLDQCKTLTEWPDHATVGSVIGLTSGREITMAPRVRGGST